MPIQKGIRALRRTEDWKDNTGILNKAQEEKAEIPKQTIHQREIKADIIQLIDQGTNAKNQILETLEYREEEIQECLKQLIEVENVLEVEEVW